MYLRCARCGSAGRVERNWSDLWRETGSVLDCRAQGLDDNDAQQLVAFLSQSQVRQSGVCGCHKCVHVDIVLSCQEQRN